MPKPSFEKWQPWAIAWYDEMEEKSSNENAPSYVVRTLAVLTSPCRKCDKLIAYHIEENDDFVCPK